MQFCFVCSQVLNPELHSPLSISVSTWLNLSNCKLTKVFEDSFLCSTCQHTGLLVQSANDLGTLSPDTFSPLTNLNMFKLSSNLWSCDLSLQKPYCRITTKALNALQKPWIFTERHVLYVYLNLIGIFLISRKKFAWS